MLKKTRIAVFVSGGGTNLGALIKAQNENILKSGEIVLVVSGNREAYALSRAKDAGIKTEVVIKGEYSTQTEFEASLISVLDKNRIDMIVLAGYMSILSSYFTDKYPMRIINVHPSLIPSFCGKGFYGLKVHRAALEYGVKITGATVHYVNAVPDGGEIILQKPVYTEDGDTPEILQKRVMEQAEWIILPQAAELVAKRIAKDK